MRRTGLLSGRYGDSVRWHSAERSLRLDDHQLAGLRYMGHVSGSRGKAGRELGDSSRARCRTTFSRNTSRRRSTFFRRGRPCALLPIRSSSAHGTFRGSIRFRSADITSARRVRPRSRNWHSRCETGSSTSTGRSGVDWRSTISRRGSASFSMRITISSKRSRNIAPLVSSGHMLMRDRYGAKDERSMKLRFHAQTAGCSLTWQQPYNNVVADRDRRPWRRCWAGHNRCTRILSMRHMRCPLKHAATLALRTQQVIAYESGRHGRARPLRRQLFRRRG